MNNLYCSRIEFSKTRTQNNKIYKEVIELKKQIETLSNIPVMNK